jgi:hypothetical protein
MGELHPEVESAIRRAGALQRTLDAMGAGRPQKPASVAAEMLARAAELIAAVHNSAGETEGGQWLRDYELYCTSVPEGFEYVWVPETNENWQVLRHLGKDFSAYACRGKRTCTRLTVARLNRATGSETKPRWYFYCAEHLYGRLIVDGELQVRVLRKR